MGLLNALINTSSISSAEQTVPTNKIIKPSVTLFEWVAPERLFVKRDKEFYRKIAVIIIFFMMMLLIIKEFMIIIVLGVVFGAVYIFTSIPPADVTHKITTNGIDYASTHLYPWGTLANFFIEEEQGVKILIINTKEVLPGRLMLLLPKDIDIDKLKQVVNEYLSIVEVPERNIYKEIVKKIGQKINI